LVTETFDTARIALPANHYLLSTLELSVAIGRELTGSHEQALKSYAAAVQRLDTEDLAPQQRQQKAKVMAIAFADALDRTGQTEEAGGVRRRADEPSQ
jgi:hypothetical protein